MKLKLTLSQTIEGFLLEKTAQQLSPHTILDYTNSFRKLRRWLGQEGLDDDPPFDEITVTQINQFLTDLGTKPQPRGGAAKRPPAPLSKKSILNVHTGLSSLWTWAVQEEITEVHVMRHVPRPRPERKAIEPFTVDDVRAMLAVCDRSRSYTRPGKRRSDHGRPTALRDRAILLLLLDTGMRASELCKLRIHCVDLKKRTVRVWGKGDKERILPISPRTAKAIWKYLATRLEDARMGDPLFLSRGQTPYNSRALLHLIRSLGRRAGVDHAYPHRFRHTFAITFLRNGGDVYTLQRILGHASLDMVRRYLNLSQVDVEAAHRRASPVANWNL